MPTDRRCQAAGVHAVPEKRETRMIFQNHLFHRKEGVAQSIDVPQMLTLCRLLPPFVLSPACRFACWVGRRQWFGEIALELSLSSKSVNAVVGDEKVSPIRCINSEPVPVVGEPLAP